VDMHLGKSDGAGTAPLYHVANHSFAASFPDPSDALIEPNGLLAVGGDLSLARLLEAYRNGIFPWYSEGQPILWWSPNPRTIIFPDRIRRSRSLRRTLNKGLFNLSINRDFTAVINACSQPRRGQRGTWLLPEMITAYETLHFAGYAHSVEAWQHGRLVGGLYGVCLGRVFFGESMFSVVSDASKVCLVHLGNFLARCGVYFIDCQMHSEHLARLGAVQLPRYEFYAALLRYRDQNLEPGTWPQPEPKHG
jgi:leucyl/phenylalanyl-tRNA--protein transferase